MSNKRIDYSFPGGFPVHEGALDFMQTGYSDPIKGLANMAGNMTIISGMTEVGNNVSAGWIVINGELLPFLAGSKQTSFIVEEIAKQQRFRNGDNNTVYYTRQARFGSGVTQYPYAALKRIASNSIMQDAETFATSRALRRVSELSLYEPNIIVSGCDVSDVNMVNQTCTISSGKVILGEQYYITPVYAGTFPVWLNSSGVWVTNDPGGINISFSPHTSQRKAAVMRRAIHTSGEIIMSKVVSDRFDPLTGIGKWEWHGFKLCEEMCGSTPTGYWFGPDGSSNIYDSAYRTPLMSGGSKSHTITKGELPNITLGVGVYTNSQDYDDGHAATNNIGNNPFPSNPAGPVNKIQTDALGYGLSFDMRTPYCVIVFIERI